MPTLADMSRLEYTSAGGSEVTLVAYPHAENREYMNVGLIVRKNGYTKSRTPFAFSKIMIAELCRHSGYGVSRMVNAHVRACEREMSIERERNEALSG